MATIETINPTTGQSIGSVPDMEDAQVRQAVQRARAAYRIWGRLDFGERREQLLRVRDRMLDRADDIVARICEETGKTPFEALFTELFITADLIDFYARHGEKALRPQRVNTGPLRLTKRSYKVYEPLGVVAVISPWNYPFSLTMSPVISALFAGNTVVLKPSEVTPLVGVLVGELFDKGCDYADVVQVVTGGGAAGSALVGAGVQKVCFTGSVATGKKVMAKAAETLTPVTLELGGKDPMIVLDDADIERAANGAVWGAFSNSGQTCIAIERAYVEAPVYDAFVDKVVAKTRAIRQGSAGGDVGSMTFPPQVELVERHLADAVDKGAKVLTGGRRRHDLGEMWFEPTVLVDVDHSMAIMRDETFGPVLPIVKVADEAEALRLANDSPYGLSSSVWTKSDDRGRRVAGQLEAGNVCVNDCLISYGVSGLPFGGAKESGVGRTHGIEGLTDMCRVKSVVEDRFGLKRELQWYPVPPGGYGVLKRATKLLYRRGAANKLRALLRG
ncbi:MAG TPA: aldehyde dehydrogenase family protein [Acidimicrobiales bacterium]|jgi:acyl-CoA reductase-like NAD-dependent aldehyde dehydrogenase|nr:aldehyde dehydrogenase family protein [Acidimicrobiales bacterium]